LLTANEIKKRLEKNWIDFLSFHAVSLSSYELSGASPPAVFVGRYGYPRVKVGPMVPPLHGDTTILDKPEMWLGKSLEDIAKYRLSLVRGVSTMDIRTTSGKYIESLQELAMSSKASESELAFDKNPIADIERQKGFGLDTESAPFGPIAPLKKFKTLGASISVDKILEKAYYDKDLHASRAIFDLYLKGIEVSKIQRVLSMGMLGLKKNRRLVPTRWSISATDNIISNNIIRSIDIYPSIDSFEVYKYMHLGNFYSIILIPDQIWSFEMEEAWLDPNGNLGIGADFEGPQGLDHYPSIAGAYFSAKLAIAEHLSKRMRKAAALVLREIRPEYVIPVGVWQIREGVREALKRERISAENFERALFYACMNLSVSRNEWIKRSTLYRNMKEQIKITDFFKKRE
jgi:hypothetical protein